MLPQAAMLAYTTSAVLAMPSRRVVILLLMASTLTYMNMK